MSIVCQYTTMSPTASSAPASQQPSHRPRRRNAMANILDGMSAADIDLIRVRAPNCVNTGRPTCVSTTGSPATSSRARSASGSSNSFVVDEFDSTSSTEASASGLSAMAFQPSSASSSSPLQSPSLRQRRNAVANILADVDQDTINRIKGALRDSLHDQADDDHHEFSF